MERELGLSPLRNDDVDRLELFTNFMVRSPLDDAIRAIELTFEEIASWQPPLDYPMEAFVDNMRLKPQAAINELNERFRENGLDYEFKNVRIVRI